MKPFNLEEALAGKPVVTRGGDKITHLYYNKDAKSDYPILVWVDDRFTSKYRINGRITIDRATTWPSDLFMAEEETEISIVVFKDGERYCAAVIDCNTKFFEERPETYQVIKVKTKL